MALLYKYKYSISYKSYISHEGIDILDLYNAVLGLVNIITVMGIP